VSCKSLHGDSYKVPFDKLVIAVGKQANDFGIPGVRQHAHFMKETADATRLREALLSRLEEASSIYSKTQGKTLCEQEQEKVRQLLSVVVVGGGPASACFAGQLTDFVAEDVPRTYPHLRDFISVQLVEWASAARSGQGGLQDQALRQYALSRLMHKPLVRVHPGEQVEEVLPHCLRLVSGKDIPYGTLVWNAGTKSVPLVDSLELSKGPNGTKLVTDEFLRSADHKDVFAIGDCAEIREQGPLPQTAHVASQQGAYLARQLNAGELEPSVPFALRGLGALVCAGSGAGHLATPQSRWSQQVCGRLAWLGWRSASWSTQLSARSRVAVACDRLGNQLFGRSVTRLGQASEERSPSGTDGSIAVAARSPLTAAIAKEKFGGASLKKLDEQLLALLKDAGMRQAGGGILEAELLPHSSIHCSMVDAGVPTEARRKR
jgi:NADH:ubiquinone reductase (non-electrogenic)